MPNQRFGNAGALPTLLSEAVDLSGVSDLATTVDLQNNQADTLQIDSDGLLAILGETGTPTAAITIEAEDLDVVMFEDTNDWTVAQTGEDSFEVAGAAGAFEVLGVFAMIEVEGGNVIAPT